MLSLVCCLLFFFFQAEDGIRDHCVTGVQTCALPICGPVETREGRRFLPPGARTASDYAGKCAASVPLSALPLHEIHAEEAQKEERWRRISLRSHLRYARPVGEIDDLLLSLQAREALMVAQTRSTGKRLQEASVSSPDSARGALRGTRRRGSGKGKRSTNQAEAAKDESAENAPQGTPVIHDLFADTEQEEIHPEDQEERDA